MVKIHDMFVKQEERKCLTKKRHNHLVGVLLSGCVYYDTTLPAEKRILSIDILDPETGVYKPLNTNETYYLVTNWW